MGLTPYHYAANNPITVIDVNGDSIVVLTAPKGAHGSGHMAMLVQNKDMKWVLWSKNGTDESSGMSGTTVGDDRGDAGKVPTYNTPEEFLNSNANPKDEKTGDREYMEVYMIPATSEQDRKAEKGAIKVLDHEYNVYSSNCAQTVQSGLREAGKKDGSPSTTTSVILSVISPLAAIINEKIPNRIYNRIKEQNPEGKTYKPSQKK